MPDPLTPKYYLASCLNDAIEDQDIHSIKQFIIEKGADPTLISPKLGYAPFHFVVGSENLEFAVKVVKLFLQKGSDPNVRSEDGLTPLHIAASWGRLELVKLLLAFGGDPELLDDNNFSSIDYAYKEDHKEIIEVLNQHKSASADIFEKEGTCDYTTELNNVTIENGPYAFEIPIENKLEVPLIKTVSTLPALNTQEYVQSWCLSQSQTIHSPDEDFNNLNRFNPIDRSTLGTSQIVVITDSDDSFVNFPKQEEPESIQILQLDTNSLPESQIWPNPVATRKISRESGFLTMPDSSLEQSAIQEAVAPNSSSDYCTCASSEVNLLDVNVNNVEKDFSRDKLYCESSDTSFTTAYEVYLIKDQVAGVVFKEKRFLKNADRLSTIFSTGYDEKKEKNEIEIDNATLRNELLSLGFEAGPVTPATKRIYINKLYELRNQEITTPLPNRKRVYSVELEATLREPMRLRATPCHYKILEDKMSEAFKNPDPKKRWREGTRRVSFNYLLLDPRITKNLPAREKSLTFEEQWRTFLASIFYVGKGKSSRPYEHLNEAMSLWRKEQREAEGKKLNRILRIWSDNFGVVCVQVYHHVIAEEAFTREAAMIKALKLENLCNQKYGEFYRVAVTWPEKEKKMLGVYLLYKAMQVYLLEGERQLGPESLI